MPARFFVLNGVLVVGITALAAWRTSRRDPRISFVRVWVFYLLAALSIEIVAVMGWNAYQGLVPWWFAAAMVVFLALNGWRLHRRFMRPAGESGRLESR